MIIALSNDNEIYLRGAQDCYKVSLDKLRKESLLFQVGNKISFNAIFKTAQLYDKLNYQRLGPFSIKQQVNQVTYQLKLLASMKVHSLFHVSLLEPYNESNISEKHNCHDLALKLIYTYEEYEVEKILDS